MTKLTNAALVTLFLIAGCGSDDEPPAVADGETGGACFATCGAGVSACYSGPTMTQELCQSTAANLCPGDVDTVFVSGCECSDEPAQGPEVCE